MFLNIWFYHILNTLIITSFDDKIQMSLHPVMCTAVSQTSSRDGLNNQISICLECFSDTFTLSLYEMRQLLDTPKTDYIIKFE